jgi:hypothetical protein
MQAEAWLHCLAKGCALDGNTAVLPDKAVAALLLDRRLTKTKGLHATSFFAGSVLAFLCATLFPNSTVLTAVLLTTLEAFTSLVIRTVPALATGCRLLYRSSRDGAIAAAFHSRCDAKGPTLTLIRDTAGNVFGGYAAEHWSRNADDGYVLLDDSAAFLFTVVNPRADPPALFPSKANGRSIVCASWAGPYFYDLFVNEVFDGNCYTNIGRSYVNPTRHDGDTVLTGGTYFTPAEVEVWGLADD